MDLTTSFMGLKLNNPLIAASSPLSKEVDSARRLEDAGAAAIVLYSLFEEQINHEKQELDHFLSYGSESFAEALSYFPEPEEFANIDAQDYLSHLEKIKKAVKVPVIGSLNGVSKGGWTHYAKNMQDAGADAIELNIYYVPTSLELSARDVEQMYIEDLQAVKEAVSIPVALKIGPFFSSFANFAQKIDQAGANGLVLFNRFFGPDIDLEKMEVSPQLHLSSRTEIQLPLRWIAVLYGKIKADMMATSGAHEASDVIKLLLAGASSVALASTLLQKGTGQLSSILKDLESWMQTKEYSSIEQMKGSMSYRSVEHPAAYERANYMKMLQSYK